MSKRGKVRRGMVVSGLVGYGDVGYGKVGIFILKGKAQMKQVER